jgi:hypothetical protein
MRSRPVINRGAQRLGAALALSLLLLGGCAAIGFEPLDEQVSPLPQAGAGAMSGGTSGTFPTGGQSGSAGSGGQGGSGGNGGQGGGGTGGRSGTGGTGGQSGQGGTGGDSGDGGTGGVTPPNPCEGKDNFDVCNDDGLFCTVEYCWFGNCVVEDRICSNECNTGTCDKATDSCVYTPRSNDTECGNPPVMCEDGVCPTPAMQCTDECNPTCSDDCEYDCTEVSSCRPTCSNGTKCEVDCRDSTQCKLTCLDSTCAMQCERAGTCDVQCSGDSSVCSIVCTDPSGCTESRCLEGASCSLRCLEEAEDCGFAECWAGEQQCDDGLTITCNADCEDESRWSGWSGRW